MARDEITETWLRDREEHPMLDERPVPRNNQPRSSFAPPVKKSVHWCPNCLYEYYCDASNPVNCPRCGIEHFRTNHGVLASWSPDSYLELTHEAEAEPLRVGVFQVRGAWQWWMYIASRPLAKGDLYLSKRSAVQAARYLLGRVQRGIQFDESFRHEEET